MLQRWDKQGKIKCIGTIGVKEGFQRMRLVKVLITIISYFADKLYGMKLHKYRKVVEDAKKLISDP